MLLYPVLVFTIHGKTQNAHTITINLKYLSLHGVMNLNCQMDHVQYQIFNIILNIFLKNIVKMLTMKMKMLNICKYENVEYM